MEYQAQQPTGERVLQMWKGQEREKPSKTRLLFQQSIWPSSKIQIVLTRGTVYFWEVFIRTSSN